MIVGPRVSVSRGIAGCWHNNFFIVVSAFIFMSGPSLAADEGHGNIADQRQVDELPLDESDRAHWSFRPLVRPPVPPVQHASWAVNEIDHFVVRQLEDHGLQPSPQSSPELLLRRVTFDVVGLPPTTDELSNFLQDTSPLAYEHLVDRLLASPSYGERWGQYWLDLARFAETDGFEHDKLRPQAWKYRQWTIDALNDDMSYDRFVTLQLAADLLEPEAHAIATTFCLAGPDMPDINEQDLRRHDKLNEITSTVGASLLGLQMACAQCHDHKYDPISQADFYRLRAIFETALPRFQRDVPISQLTLQSDPPPAYFYFRGELSGQGPLVRPAPPRIACDADCQWKETSDEPRLAFIDWMFKSSNPLVARVIANRIWQYHFGRSLCGNPSDLGIVATEPTHPELLDWLATELQACGWSIKALHRKILLSATYRQAGSSDCRDTVDHSTPLSRESDPENRHYGRFPHKRLEGEMIRDAMLAVAGLSNRTIGGPSITPPLPAELKQTLLDGQWEESTNASDHYRRSIYVFARRNLRFPIFEVFDRPDAGASCPQRNISTTALQSLQMLNSELAIACARGLSQRVLRETPSRQSTLLLNHLFAIVYTRIPTPDELTLAIDIIDGEVAPDEPLFVICLAMLNSNEFIYVD